MNLCLTSFPLWLCLNSFDSNKIFNSKVLETRCNNHYTILFYVLSHFLLLYFIAECNRTYYGNVGLTYNLELHRPKEDKIPYICLLTFTASGGIHGDIVQVRVDASRKLLFSFFETRNSQFLFAPVLFCCWVNISHYYIICLITRTETTGKLEHSALIDQRSSGHDSF